MLNFKKMKSILLLSFVTLFVISCGDSDNSTADESGMHKIVIQEVLQAKEYTYLRAKENDSEFWFAVPSVEVGTGETYYYETVMEMNDFHSKDLNRDFKSILFLESISKEPVKKEKSKMPDEFESMHGGKKELKPTKPDIKKSDVTIRQESGCVSVSGIYEKKDALSGKTIRIKGVVVKFSEAIMQKNWLHIQDGSEFDGKFDLVVTSASIFANEGDTLILEGKLSVNKDFGYGYFYDVLLEDAVLK